MSRFSYSYYHHQVLTGSWWFTIKIPGGFRRSWYQDFTTMTSCCCLFNMSYFLPYLGLGWLVGWPKKCKVEPTKQMMNVFGYPLRRVAEFHPHATWIVWSRIITGTGTSVDPVLEEKLRNTSYVTKCFLCMLNIIVLTVGQSGTQYLDEQRKIVIYEFMTVNKH